VLPIAQAAAAEQDVNQRLDTQQREIDALKSQLDGAVAALESREGDGGGQTKVGGYGELHYNNLRNDGPKGDQQELDFHRFVLFFGHRFDDNIRFFSELELEHAIAADGQPGEVELEQAFIDFDLDGSHTARAGLFLVPVGIMNETHEPPVFYGVERNPVEKNIIPATWWEGGASLYGELSPGWGYDVAITSGLNNADYKIRSGRQKVAEATAEDLAYTGRIKWTGLPGVEVAATMQRQENITQGVDKEASATLLETHAIVSRGALTVKALYAAWNVDGSGAAAKGMDEQAGWYIEPSFKVTPAIGLFARYNQWDNAAGDAGDSQYTQVDAGVNYWPHEDVVVKFDYQAQSAPDGKDRYDGVNLGVGYQF
jgi:hypothetical protein